MSANEPRGIIAPRAAVLGARLAAIAAGVWLMFSPAVIGYSGAPANSDRIAGPIAAACAFVACWDVLASLRWWTVPTAAWLIVAPAVLGTWGLYAVSSVGAGLVIAATAVVGPDVEGEFGGGWRSVRPSMWTGPSS